MGVTEPSIGSGDLVAAGNDALHGADWATAEEHFRAALAEADVAEAWEGLGWTGWWRDDEELTFEARDRAFRAYRARGDCLGAARLAAWIAVDHREFRGDYAVALGWGRRARRLLEGQPPSADHGWVAILGADLAMNIEGDLGRTAELAREAVAGGRAHNVPDLEGVGLAIEGLTLVMRGRVEEGMRQLDEAVALSAAEQLHLPIMHGWSMCCLISACDGVGDFPRAAQWFSATRAYVERWDCNQLLGVCRSAYGRVLATGGDWPAGEAEMTAAVADLQESRPGMMSGSLVRLAELRLRQGRDDEALALFERALPTPGGAIGLGELALLSGDAEGASDAAERALRNLPVEDLLERLPAFELLARARAALGQHDAAERAGSDLRYAAERLGTSYVLGRSRLVAGELALAQGDCEGARLAGEDALDRFAESSAPYEAARARAVLARALRGLGRDGAADSEAAAAREVFEQLGATRARDEVDAAPAAGAAAPELGELSARELEILRLVAEGLSDAAIAERLVLSPHTVHRHVSNVRTKLRLPSRAAAVAYAARSGLL